MVCKMRRFQIIDGELDHELYFISVMSLAHKLKDIELYMEARSLSTLFMPYEQISLRGYNLLKQTFPYLFPDEVVKKV